MHRSSFECLTQQHSCEIVRIAVNLVGSRFKIFFLAFTTRWRPRPTSSNKPTSFGPVTAQHHFAKYSGTFTTGLTPCSCQRVQPGTADQRVEASTWIAAIWIPIGQHSNYIWNFFPTDVLTFFQVNLLWKFPFRNFSGPQPKNDTPVHCWPRRYYKCYHLVQ